MRGYFTAEGAEAITPHASTNFAGGLSEAIHVGGAGTLAAVFKDGSVGDFTVVAGQQLNVKAKRVNAVGTTATLLVALR